MLPYIHKFLPALCLNIVVETFLVWILIVKVYRGAGIKLAEVLNAGVAANLLTTPYVWFVFPFLFGWTNGIISGEFFAWLIEALFYRSFLRLSLKKAMAVSLIANVASYLLGRLLHI